MLTEYLIYTSALGDVSLGDVTLDCQNQPVFRRNRRFLGFPFVSIYTLPQMFYVKSQVKIDQDSFLFFIKISVVHNARIVHPAATPILLSIFRLCVDVWMTLPMIQVAKIWIVKFPLSRLCEYLHYTNFGMKNFCILILDVRYIAFHLPDTRISPLCN